MDVMICLCILLHISSHVSAGLGYGCYKNNTVTKSDFQIERLMGTWYEVGWIPPYFEENTAIVWTNYFEIWSQNQEHLSKIEVTGFGRDTFNDECQYYTKYRSVLPDASRQFQTFKYNATVTIQLDHWILDTDYDDYAVAYGCTRERSDGMCLDAHLWLWSRTHQPTWTAYTHPSINEALRQVCLTPEDVIMTSQKNPCFAIETPTPAGARQLFQTWGIVLSVLCMLHM